MNRAQEEHVEENKGEYDTMNEEKPSEQQRTLNREQEDNQDHNTSASSSGIPRDSTGKGIDVGMTNDGATRDAKRPIGEDGQTEERENKVLVAAPEQGTKSSRGLEDADRG